VRKCVTLLISGLLLSALAVPAAQAADIAGAGSTFVNPILSKWSADYKAKTGETVNYQSIGSGGGISKIKAATVDFGASDMPLKSDQLAQLGLGQFPLVIGGVVPVVNIDGVKPGQIRFTGALLADIFLGKLTKWNDPALQALNPDLKLPDAAITVVHRSDGSGTTFNWANYLSKASPEWRDKVGEGTSVDWPVGANGKGNEGVAVFVNQIKNSIGYVEYAYAHHYAMTFGLVQNKAGGFVTPNTASFQAAAQGFDWGKTKDFYLVMTDADGAEAYSITATTFILMYKRPKDPGRSKVALDFFKWALEQGLPQAEQLDYVPLPASLVAQIEAYWKTNVGAGM
jgi:phosphate transport system substrate-binding protein